MIELFDVFLMKLQRHRRHRRVVHRKLQKNRILNEEKNNIQIKLNSYYIKVLKHVEKNQCTCISKQKLIWLEAIQILPSVSRI